MNIRRLPLHLALLVCAGMLTIAAFAYEAWERSVAMDPALFDLPASAEEVVRLRTDASVTFRIRGDQYVTISRGSGTLETVTDSGSPL